MTREPLLVMDGVQASYGEFKALFNITLHVDAGEIVTLLGANGAGKTTTLRVISGLIHPTEGAVRFDGKDISRLQPHRIVELGISHVPEGRQLFPHMSVEENLALGAYIARARQRGIKGTDGRAVHAVPTPEGTAQAACRNAFGRRAADGGDRPRPDDAAQAAHPR